MSENRPSAAQQAAEFAQAEGESFAPELGKTYYAVNYEWMQSWKSYTAGDAGAIEPGIINNTGLSEQAFPQALKRGLVENMDYSWVIEPAYKLLVTWYGVSNEFPRQVIQTQDGNTKVDGYPQVCEVESTTSDKKVTVLLPRAFKAREILQHIRQDDEVQEVLKLGDVTLSDLRLFAKSGMEEGENAWHIMVNNFTLDEAAKNDASTQLLIEVRAADGSWGRGLVYAKGYEPLSVADISSITSWRASLKAGSHIDAQDSTKQWYEATIQEVKKHLLGGTDYVVRYRPWSVTYNEVIGSSETTRIQPPYTKTSKWRQALRPGDNIEVLHQEKWFPGFVHSLDFTQLPQTVTVLFMDGSMAAVMKTCSVEDVGIAKPGVHLKAEKFVIRPNGAPPLPSAKSFLDSDSDVKDNTSARLNAADDDDPQVGGAAAGAGGPMNSADQKELAIAYRRSYFGESATTWKSLAGRATPDFFLDESQYLPQINVTNRLGSGGKLVHAYAALVQALWSGAFSRAAPGAVKNVVAKHFPQFLGWGQQDSQEFMSSILDLMLEDLCRVKDKPSLTNPDSEGRTDESVADESWSNYLRRNDSKITDVLAVPVDNWTSAEITYYGSNNKESITFRHFYRKPQPPQMSDLANWLRDMMAKEKELDPPTAAAALIDAIPPAHEIMFGLCNVANSLIRAVVPHWANLGAAMDYVSKSFHGRLMLVAWHVPHATPYAPSPAAAPAASTPATADADEKDDPKEKDDDEGEVKKQSEDDEQPLIEDWPIDYDEVLPSAGGDDDDFVVSYRRNVQYKERPLTPIGPHMNDFVAIWCRRKYSSYSAHNSRLAVCDEIVVPTKTVDASGAVVPVTHNQLRELVWQRMQRMLRLPEGHTFTAANPPYRLCAFVYVYEKRMYLPNDYENGHDKYVDIPADDTIFVPKKNVQVILDFMDPVAFTDLFSMDAAKKSAVAEATKTQPGKQQLTLDRCIETFASREQLGEADKWYCNKCKDHVRAYKKMDLWKLPPVLIVHLKRFQYERGFYGSVLRGKIEEMVHFPTRGLNLASYVVGPDKDKEAIYDLYAVSQHSGGLGGGHYTAHAMNARNKRWYHFNDSYVSEASENDAVGRSAYVLFYRLRKPGSELPPAPPAAVPSSTYDDDADMD